MADDAEIALNEEIDAMKPGLMTDDPKVFRTKVREMLERVMPSRYHANHAHCVNALLIHAESRDRPLEIRFAAVEALAEIGPQAPDFVNSLVGISAEKTEPLRLRWAATDALKEARPDLFEHLQNYPDLVDRNVDPDNLPPELDISAERIKLAEKQSKEIIYYPLIALVLFAAIMGTYFSYGTVIFWPLVVVWPIAVASFFGGWWVLARRCPKCGRFWARSNQEARGGYDGPSMPVGGIGLGGSNVQTRTRVTVYAVRCKFCRHPWIIVR